jgi:outer membrane protein OmpA-like peptidoglycan-associated protein
MEPHDRGFLLKMANVANFFRRRPSHGPFWVRMAFGASLGLAGCTSPVTLYHEAEGGDIAKLRQPPPGSDQPYPNLASVPAAPVALSASQQQAVQQQLDQARANPTLPTSAPSPAVSGALAGLTLPDTAPPVPSVPGLTVPVTLPVTAALALAPPAPAPAPHDGPPIALAFSTKSAILSSDMVKALQALAVGRGNAKVLVGGFGEQGSSPDAAALTLALNRAQRIADALTASGVPPGAIRLIASAAGSGGFAQLVY